MKIPLVTQFRGSLLLLMILISILGIAPRPHQASQDLKRAQRALESGAFQNASDYLAKAAGRLPGRSDLWELAGRYALQAGNPHTAIQYLEKAEPTAGQEGLALKGRVTDQGGVILGDAYQQAGNLPAAARTWQAVLAATGPSEALLQRLVQAHRFLGDYTAAVADQQALASLQPANARLRFELGLLVSTQQPEAALAHLTQAAELDASLAAPIETLRREILSARLGEDPAYSLLAAGRALASLNEWELAAEAFRQATLSRPDYAEAWAYLGEALQHPLDGVAVSNSQDGLAELQKALALDPDSLSAYVFLALYWGRHGQTTRALEILQETNRQDPGNPVLKAQLGETLAMLGDLQAAQEAYRQAAALSPRDPTYYKLLAGFSVRYEFQMVETGLPAARRAVVLAPHDPAALDLMGQVFIKLNDLLNAARFLDRAVQADPHYAPAHLHRGLLFALQGDRARAFSELDLARSLAPDSLTAEQSQRLLRMYFP